MASIKLTRFQKRFVNMLQNGLPVCSRPFDDIAECLGCEEEEVLRQIRFLKEIGVIRRIGAVIDYHAIGRISTLVAAHVEQEKLQAVADAINSLPGVSHNYLRSHFYNIWFTLQADSQTQIEQILAGLQKSFGINFYNLIAEKVFKLDARFDAESDGWSLLDGGGEQQPQLPGRVDLTEDQKRVLNGLFDELEITSNPFEHLGRGLIDSKRVLELIEVLIEKGVIRRLGAVVDHRKLGFTTNILFCCRVGYGKIDSAGRKLAALKIVSHCYQRKCYPEWPYNLYAMMHSRNIQQIREIIDSFILSDEIEQLELLPTETELKKSPIKQSLS